MTYDYREYCPVAKAAQILCERWTVLIVRELLDGATRFNELRRYLPRISPSLLKDRLNLLEREGIVVRRRIPEQRSYEYRLTPAERALEDVVMSLGRWGAGFANATLAEEDLNVEVLMRDVGKHLVVDALPSGRTVISVKFTDVTRASDWFLVVDEARVEVCDEDRMLDVDVYVVSDVRTLTEVWLGHTSMSRAIGCGRVKVTGSPVHVRTIGAWFGASPFAGVDATAQRAELDPRG